METLNNARTADGSARTIVQLSAYYPPHLGGQENAVRGLSLALSQRGRRVQVLTSDRGGIAAGSVCEEGVFISRLASVEFGHTAVSPSLFSNLLRLPSSALVHVHVGQAFVPEIAYLASRIRQTPYIIQLHTDIQPSGAIGRLVPSYKRHVLARVIRGAASVLVFNHDFDAILREQYDYRGKTVLVRNGVADDWFDAVPPRSPPTGGPLKVLFIGRLGFPKNCEALIDAMAAFRDGSVQLTIIGGGPDGDRLVQRSAQRGVERMVHFVGTLERPAIVEYMRNADVVVIPSLYEAQPLVLLECMAARMPTIATDVPGIRDLASQCSELAEPSPHGLAQAIRAFRRCSMATMTQRIRRGRALVEGHRWANVCRMYEAVYDDLA